VYSSHQFSYSFRDLSVYPPDGQTDMVRSRQTDRRTWQTDRHG